MSNLAQLQYLRPLLPIDFFAISYEVPYASFRKSFPKTALLPNFSGLMGEKPFATVKVIHNEEGIGVEVQFKKAFDEGDRIELFFDTRHLKARSRFAHHFLIVPESDDELSFREITQFRGEETRPLCDPQLVTLEKRGSLVRIFLPSQALHGYDPELFNQIGFTYKLDRQGQSAQHFTLSSREYSLARQVSLWATLTLKGAA